MSCLLPAVQLIFSAEVGCWLKDAVLLQGFQKATSKLETLAEFHSWLYDTHLCYAVARQARAYFIA